MSLVMVAQGARMQVVPKVFGGRGVRGHSWHVLSEHAPCGQRLSVWTSVNLADHKVPCCTFSVCMVACMSEPGTSPSYAVALEIAQEGVQAWVLTVSQALHARPGTA